MNIVEHVPPGFPIKFRTLPKGAADLEAHAFLNGWVTGHAFGVDSGDNPFVVVHVLDHAMSVHYKVTWHTRGTGTYRLFSKIVSHGGPWVDAPSLTKIRAAVSDG